MFGVILTIIHKSCGITSQKVEGFKTREAVETFAKDWEKPFHPEWFQYRDCHTEKLYSTHYTIYEIEDCPQQGMFQYTISQPAYEAHLDMRMKDLYDKLWDLKKAAGLCKQFICEDPMQTPCVVEQITIADRIAQELFNAYPEDEVEDEKTET